MPRHPLLVQAYALSGEGRNDEAIGLIHQLVGQNEPEATFLLAEMKWRGGMVPQDLPGARDLYRRAGEAGHAGGAQLYTNLLASGVGGARDWGQAIGRLQQEARFDARRRQTLGLIGAMRLTAEGDPQALPEATRLSEAPDVVQYPALFTAAECDYLRQVAEPIYEPSVVNANGKVIADPIRTSDGASIHWLIEDPAIHALNRRLAAASGTAFEQAEALQILRYRPGQQYRSHLDAVGAENERVLTALVYLNEDYAGGETCFVKADLKVTARKGDGLVFRNVDAEGRPDKSSEHAGLPIESGTKYLASRWIRARRWLP